MAMRSRSFQELPQWLTQDALPLGGRILGILIGAIVVRWIVVRAVRRLAERSLHLPLSGRLTKGASDRLHQRTKTISSVLRSLITVTVSIFALLLILAEFKINLGPLLASAGVAGVALGFGAQNLVRDFLSGMFIVFEDQYGVGDIVNLGEVSGTVEAISLRTTQLRDITGVTWYVRNGEILRVANLSQGWATAIVDLPLAPSTDIAQVRSILEPTLPGLKSQDSWGKALGAAPEIAGVETLATGQLVLRLTGRTTPDRKSEVQRGLLEHCLRCLGNAGISLPAVGQPA